nr:hypothetical protein [Valsa mali var. pyri (nom. inval.)]
MTKSVFCKLLQNFYRGFSTTGVRFFSSEQHNIKPVVVYSNADTQKFTVFKENRNKAGIYRWVNILNGKTYIGSSVNLSERFTAYYSIYYLTNEGKNNSQIYRVLLK